MRANKIVRLVTAGGLVFGSLIPAGAAFAEYGDPENEGEGTDPGEEETSGSASGEGLPVTGGDIVLLTTIGGALAIGGTVLVRSGRRKTVAS